MAILLLAQKPSPLSAWLWVEVNHRLIAALLAVAVILLHLWLIVWLLDLSQPVTNAKPLQVIEVSLLSLPNPHQAKPQPVLPRPVLRKQKPLKKKLDNAKAAIKEKPLVMPQPPELPLPAKQDAPAPVKNTINKTEASAPQVSVQSKPNQPASSLNSNLAASSSVVALQRVQPKYPMRAAKRRIEGWVKIEFTVSQAGTVTDAVVVAAEPAGVFDDAAMEAIIKWKFKQKIVNGVSVSQRAVQVLKFKLIN
jgi:protein TonB